MKKILYVFNRASTFTAIDRNILQERWHVEEWHQKKRIVNVAALFRAVRSADIVIGWFASVHTFLPITLAWLMKKPSLMIIGGYDVASVPEIKYGLQQGGIKSWISRWVIRRAGYLVTNSYYSQQEIEQNLGIPPDNVEVIHHGVPDPFHQVSLFNGDRTQTVITIGIVNQKNLYRKGLEAFVRTAALVPEAAFVVIGRWEGPTITYLQRIAPPNVQFTGWLSQEDLNRLLTTASVYVQASLHEGFGMSVAEAMLAGCIPVVTAAGALPELVGDTGIVVSSNEPQTVADGIRIALGCSQADRRETRERILTTFPLEKRQQQLHSLVAHLLDEPK